VPDGLSGSPWGRSVEPCPARRPERLKSSRVGRVSREGAERNVDLPPSFNRIDYEGDHRHYLTRFGRWYDDPLMRERISNAGEDSLGD